MSGWSKALCALVLAQLVLCPAGLPRQLNLHRLMDVDVLDSSGRRKVENYLEFSPRNMYIDRERSTVFLTLETSVVGYRFSTDSSALPIQFFAEFIKSDGNSPAGTLTVSSPAVFFENEKYTVCVVTQNLENSGDLHSLCFDEIGTVAASKLMHTNVTDSRRAQSLGQLNASGEWFTYVVPDQRTVGVFEWRTKENYSYVVQGMVSDDIDSVLVLPGSGQGSVPVLVHSVVMKDKGPSSLCLLTLSTAVSATFREDWCSTFKHLGLVQVEASERYAAVLLSDYSIRVMNVTNAGVVMALPPVTDEIQKSTAARSAVMGFGRDHSLVVVTATKVTSSVKQRRVSRFEPWSANATFPTWDVSGEEMSNPASFWAAPFEFAETILYVGVEGSSDDRIISLADYNGRAKSMNVRGVKVSEDYKGDSKLTVDPMAAVSVNDGVVCIFNIASDGSQAGYSATQLACYGLTCASGFGQLKEEGPSCLLCPAGTYNNIGSLSHSSDGSVCAECPVGSFSDSDGSTFCSQCGRGLTSNKARTGCEECPFGLMVGTTKECTVCIPQYCHSNGDCEARSEHGSPYEPVCNCKSFVYGKRCDHDYSVAASMLGSLLAMLLTFVCLGAGSVVVLGIRGSQQKYKVLRSYVDDQIFENRTLLLKFDMNRPRLEWELDYSKIRVLKRIGSGATAFVFKATYDGVDVAVKEFIDMSETTSLQREMTALKKLNHPNILHCWGAIHDPPCIVVEYANCGNLSEWIYSERWESGHITLLYFAHAISKGMAFLHSQGMVHRDLKPENVLLVDNTPKIADFGISREVAGMMTTKVGTVRYAAPELFRDNFYPSAGQAGGKGLVVPIEQVGYDGSVDVYSFGIMLWELYHRVVPFEGMKWDFEVSQSVDAGARPPINPDCMDSGVAALVEQCWRENPASRPTFGQVERLISALLRAKLGFDE